MHISCTYMYITMYLVIFAKIGDQSLGNVCLYRYTVYSTYKYCIAGNMVANYLPGTYVYACVTIPYQT